MGYTLDPAEYDQSVTLTSDGTVTITRADGTEEQVGRLRPHLDVKLLTVPPETLGTDPILHPWTLTARSDLTWLPSPPDPSPGATYG